MCLKRYSFTDDGKAVRLATRIDIPTEIGLPHFISDDKMNEDGPIYGNFKLSLQSVVCHRGNSVESGHYISLVKGTNTSLEVENDPSPRDIADTHWMRFDDLASERITLVDINQALRDETPYLLFYQIVPIDNDAAQSSEGESLPSYVASEAHDSGIGPALVSSLKLHESSDEALPRSRPSLEVTAPEDGSRGRLSDREQGRESGIFSESPNHSELAVPDQGICQVPCRRGSDQDKSNSQSRPQSQSIEKFSVSLSRKTRKKSKETFPLLGSSSEAEQTTGDSQTAPAVDEEKGRGFRRKEGRREKSKSRLGKFSNSSGKIKGEKPDRECSVM